MDEYHAAWKVVGSAKDKSLTEAYGILAAKTADYDLWFRSLCLSRTVGLGVAWNAGEGKKMAAELSYDFYGKQKGINGLPLFARWGLQWKMKDGVNFSTAMNLQ